MSAGVSGGGPDARGRGGSQDVELNLASIIDCFTVLIAFMLASASFLSIGILDAGIAAAGASASPGTPPAIVVNVELKQDFQYVVKVSGKVTASYPIAAGAPTATKDGQQKAWDHAALTAKLGELKARFPDVSAVTMSAENTVEYRDVVKSMEITRKTHPAVLLGGF
jgi:biopolymer transport protein ExbD